MTATPSEAGFTVDIRTGAGYLIQRDSRPHSPWHTYTPADAHGSRSYLGCASSVRHAHQLIARHCADRLPAVAMAARPSTSPRRIR